MQYALASPGAQGRESTRVGAGKTLACLWRHMGVLIGIDVGSTTTSGGLVTPEGGVLWATQAPTQAGGPGSALDTLLEIVGQLLDQAAKRCLSPEGIGVGVVGVVDVDAGTLRLMADRMPELTGVPLVERVQARSGGLPVYLDNDVNALALGEWTFGLGRGAASMAMLALGTGVGGALILDGHLVRGHRGYAGEFGHVTVNLDGRRCQACGNQGCLAVYTAGHGIAMEARRRGRLKGSPTADEPDSEEASVSDAAAVFRAATEGDADARGVVEEAVHALGAGIGGLVNGYNPELIVVTGGIVKSLARLEREIIDRAREYSLAPAFAGTRIHLIPADKSQTVRGGAALVLYERACRAALR